MQTDLLWSDESRLARLRRALQLASRPHVHGTSSGGNVSIQLEVSAGHHLERAGHVGALPSIRPGLAAEAMLTANTVEISGDWCRVERETESDRKKRLENCSPTGDRCCR